MKLFSFLLVAILISASCKSKYPDLAKGLYADIQTNAGDVLIQLEYKKTPVTVANFVSLAEGTNPFVDEQHKNKKYYDSLTFHRVIKDFMIQGGDPTASGSGGPGYKIKDEFHPSLRHDKAGVLSMANSGPNTNGSQFFITHKETPWLDNKHTVFGEVISGQSVVDSIAQGDIIKTVEIMRVGSDAKKFDSQKILTDYFAEKEKVAAEVKKLKEEKAASFDSEKQKATKLPSGLAYTVVKKGNGEKPSKGTKVLVNYAGFLSDGTLFDTTWLSVAESMKQVNEQKKQANMYQPFPMDYGPEARLIPGFKEGIQLMNIGDKYRFFIPSDLGYGDRDLGPIPANSDLVFDVEIVGKAETAEKSK